MHAGKLRESKYLLSDGLKELIPLAWEEITNCPVKCCY